MKTLFRALVVASVVMLLPGCVATTAGPDNRTSQVRCSYARQQTLPASAEAKTFAFDTDSTAKGTHAYESYCRQVAAALEAYGWRQVSPDNEGAAAQAPDYWVSVIFGYALDPNAGVGSFRRISAPMMVSDQTQPVSDIYAKIAVYYAAIGIGDKPQAETDHVFLAQIFGASDAEMSLVLPTLFKQLLKDFPGQNVPSEEIVLYTRR
jgi:hypothetical protein